MVYPPEDGHPSDCDVASAFVTPPPIGERSIVMSVSVCVRASVPAIVSSELHVRSSPIFCTCYIGPIAVAQSSSGGIVICYVLPVL